MGITKCTNQWVRTRHSVASLAVTLAVVAGSVGVLGAPATYADVLDPATATSVVISPTPQATIVSGASVQVLLSVPTVLPVDLTAIGVSVMLDGFEVGVATSASGWMTTWESAGVAPGVHSFDTLVCTLVVDTQVCGPITNSTVHVITGPKMGVTVDRKLISPNGDGRFDLATFTISLAQPADVSVQFSGKSGPAGGPYRLGRRAAGKLAFKWTGVSPAGTRFADGVYTATFSATIKASYPATTTTQVGIGGITVDTRRPSVSVTVPGPVFPVSDGYRDSVDLGFNLSEQATVAAWIINSAGTSVRALPMTGHPAGKFTLRWNGRTAAGAVVPAGTYRVRLQVTDMAANVLKTVAGSIPLSTKRLKAFSYTITKTAAASIVDFTTDPCSDIFSPAFPNAPVGSIGLFSGYYCVYGNLEALTAHVIKLPGAVRYGPVSVSTSVGMVLPSNVMVMGYTNTAGAVATTSFTRGDGVYTVTARPDKDAIVVAYGTFDVSWAWVNWIRVSGVVYRLV